MNYTQAETDIVGRLVAALPSEYVITDIPEKQADFDRPWTKGRITVAYSGSTFGHKEKGSLLSTNAIAQEETAEFTISIQARSLRGENGIHKSISRVKKIVTGFKPSDCDRLFLKEGAFQEEQPYHEGVWTYQLCVACTTRAVQDEQDDDLDQALITRLKFLDETNTNDEIIIP